MYLFLTLETLTSFFISLGFDIASFTSFEQLLILLVSNFFYIVSWFIFLYFLYRLFLKIFKFIF